MVLNADDLKIQAVNSGYKEVFAGREVKGLAITDAFSGKDLDQLLKLIKTAIQDGQSIESGPLLASISETETGTGMFIHTIVPIVDDNSSHVNRLFVYSEKAE